MATHKTPERPKPSPGEALSVALRVPMRPGERRSLEMKARAKGMTLAAWARWKLIYGK